jgi:imidazoleglycerol-phosphate dehydratase
MEPIKKLRKTSETCVEIHLDICKSFLAKTVIKTPVGFLNHMLELFFYHSGINAYLRAVGDIEVDFHHTVEDIGITLGEAFNEALGDRKGIARYGEATIPMEDALTQAVVDLAKRPYFHFEVNFPTEKIGYFDTELIPEFLKAFTMHGLFTLHIRNFYGKNSHHIAESIFKALAHALKKALAPSSENLPFSTKGIL